MIPPQKAPQKRVPTSLREQIPVPVSKVEVTKIKIPEDEQKNRPSKKTSTYIPLAHIPPTHIPKSQPIILERTPKARRPLLKHPLFLTCISLLCIVLIIMAVSFVYAKAVITISPKHDTVAVAKTFTACKDAPCTSTANPSIAYSLIQIPTVELHEAVTAVDGPLIQTAAKGTIVLYNNYTTTSQTIVAGTKLTNTAGLVYQTLKTVSIPGFKKAGSQATPGSVSVSIMASATGPKYNISPTDLTGDFKIVAYKGTDKYTDFYGRLNPTGSISGGYIGHAKIVATSTLAQADADLEQQLGAQLLAQAKLLIPAGYIMYPNAFSISIASTTPVATSTADASLVDVGLRATFNGVMFKQSDLAQAAALAAKPAEDINLAYPNNSYNLSGLDALTFAPNAPINGSNVPITFSLNGSFTVTGTFPTADIVASLEGKNLAQSNAIFEKYSNISTAHAIITPFWRHSFPTSPDRINVIIQ